MAIPQELLAILGPLAAQAGGMDKLQDLPWPVIERIVCHPDDVMAVQTSDYVFALPGSADNSYRMFRGSPNVLLYDYLYTITGHSEFGHDIQDQRLIYQAGYGDLFYLLYNHITYGRRPILLVRL